MKLLALDFDGVLHGANDTVLINFRDGAAPWEMEVALKAQKRFAWSEFLVSSVEGTDVSIVIHSTWRKRFSDATMKHFLPPEIAARVINLDGQIKDRESLSADNYLFEAVSLIAPTSLCVIDDRPEFFYGGKVKGWIAGNHGKFIWCHPDTGIRDNNVVAELRAWSHTEPKMNNSFSPTQ